LIGITPDAAASRRLGAENDGEGDAWLISAPPENPRGTGELDAALRFVGAVIESRES